jgi:hypothetical protein
VAGDQLTQRHINGLALRSSPYQLLSLVQNAVVDLDVGAHTLQHTHPQVYLKVLWPSQLLFKRNLAKTEGEVCGFSS